MHDFDGRTYPKNNITKNESKIFLNSYLLQVQRLEALLGRPRNRGGQKSPDSK